MSVRSKVFESISEVPFEAWDLAVAASDAPVFYSRSYLSAYEETGLHGAKAHFYVVVSDDKSEDHAVLPLIEPSESDPLNVVGRAFPTVDLESPCLVSAGWHCYDGFVPMTSLRPDLLSIVISAVRHIMKERAMGWFALANVDESRDQRHALESLGLEGHPADERYVMDLRRFSSFEEYVASLSRRIRQDTRRYARRAAEAGLQSSWKTPAEADLDSVLRVVHLTAARYGVEDFYRQGPFQEFVRHLGDSGLVVESRLGSDLIGAGICMLDSERFHQWTFGVDYEAANVFSPYGIVFEQTVRAAMAIGANTLEGGRRNGLYKSRRGLSQRQLFTYVTLGCG